MKIVYTKANKEDINNCMIKDCGVNKKRGWKKEEEKEKYFKYYMSNVNLLHFYFTMDNNETIDVCETAGEFISHILNSNYSFNNTKINTVWDKILLHLSAEEISLLSIIVEQGINNKYELFAFSTYENPISCIENINSNLIPVYTFHYFYDFFRHLIYKELFDKKTFIKKCANCNSYFYPRFRSDTIYCDNLSPQDNNRTCKDFCSQNNYTEKIKSDETIGLYQKLYSKKNKRASRHSDNLAYLQDFENFKKESKEWKAKVKNGEATENEYIEWLKFTECKERIGD